MTMPRGRETALDTLDHPYKLRGIRSTCSFPDAQTPHLSFHPKSHKSRSVGPALLLLHTISHCAMPTRGRKHKCGKRQVSCYVGVRVSRGPAAYTQPQISTTIFLIIDKYREAQKRERQRTVRVYALDSVSDHAVLGTRYERPVTASCAYQMPNACAIVLASRKRY